VPPANNKKKRTVVIYVPSFAGLLCVEEAADWFIDSSSDEVVANHTASLLHSSGGFVAVFGDTSARL
jgi:hypothetical protein